MKVLVTGGAGYIGSHACKALAQAGFEPVVYDDLSEGHAEAVRWGPLVVGDVADYVKVRETLARYEIQAVLHFAAFASVGESVVDPRKYFQNNSAGALQLINAVLDAGLDTFIFSSTCATFGDQHHGPIPETAAQQPINPYGASKLFTETVLKAYEAAYRLRYAALRYFNAAGADPEGELGEAHDPETHLIPLVIAAAQGARPFVEVYGTDYPTPDGTAVRDYVHVTDLADAHVRALVRLLDGAASLRLNLGTGAGRSIREVIAAVERIGGRRVPVRYGSRRPGDPPALVAAPGAAEAMLDWTPRFSELDTIVETAWRWHARSAESETPAPLVVNG
jgi:UDP-arabinose 4-epimerase